MGDLVTAYGGAQLPINSLDTVITYDGNNNALTLSVTYRAITYIQTFIRDSNANVIEITQFIPAPTFEKDKQGRFTKIKAIVEIQGKKVSFEKRIDYDKYGKPSITTIEVAQ